MSNGTKKTSHSALRGIGICLMVILLMAGGSVGLLYYSITTDAVTIEDPAALAAQAPMPASRRFVFDAAKETAQVCLDKSDLWWLLLPDMGENLLEEVNRELENYQLRIEGYGLRITEKGIWIDLEARYQSVRLPVHILTALDFDDSGVSVTFTKARLGFFRLPAAGLLKAVDVRIEADWPVITEVTDVAYQQDTVLLTGTLTQDMLSCVQKSCHNNAIGWFSTSHQDVFRAARTEDGFKELLPGLEQDPGSIETLYHDLFTLAQGNEYENLMKVSRNLPHRFFPGIDYASLETERDAVRGEWTFYNTLVDTLVTQVSKDFNNRRFSLKNGAFYLRGSVFDVRTYFTGETGQDLQQMFRFLDPEKFQLVLVGSIDAYDKKTPVLSQICDTEQALTQQLNRKGSHPVGCIFRGINGEYFLRYETMVITGRENKVSKSMKTVSLTDAEYDSLIQEGKIGVWIS